MKDPSYGSTNGSTNDSTDDSTDDPPPLGVAACLIPYLAGDEPRRTLIACGAMLHAQSLQKNELPKVRTKCWDPFSKQLSLLTKPSGESSGSNERKSVPGTNLLTAFAFLGGTNFEDAFVVSRSAAKKLELGRRAEITYGFSWFADPSEVTRVKEALEKHRHPQKEAQNDAQGLARDEAQDEAQEEAQDEPQKNVLPLWRKHQPRAFVDCLLAGVKDDTLPRQSLGPEDRLKGLFKWPLRGKQVPWPAYVVDVEREDFFTPIPDKNNKEGRVQGASKTRVDSHSLLVGPYRSLLTAHLEEAPRPAGPGDKLANLHGNKGVIAVVLPDHQMPRVHPPGGGPPRRVDVVANPIGVLNRGNFGQVAEAVASWKNRDVGVTDSELPLEELSEWVKETPGFDAAGRLTLQFASSPDSESEGKTVQAVCGWNFWMRPEQEACRQARVALSSEAKESTKHKKSTKKTNKEKRYPGSPLPALLKSRGILYGEMNAWALAARALSRKWIKKDLLSKNGPRFADTTDRDPTQEVDPRLEAWDVMAGLTLGIRGSQKAGEKKKPEPLSETEIKKGKSKPPPKTSKDTAPLAFRYVEKIEKTPWPSYLLSHAQEVINRHDRLNKKEPTYKSVKKWRETLAETFFGSKHHQTEVQPEKTDEDPQGQTKKSTENLRRSPFIKWLFSHQVQPSARLVIVPDPNLQLDQIRLPWWLCLAFFTPDKLDPWLKEAAGSTSWPNASPRDLMNIYLERLPQLLDASPQEESPLAGNLSQEQLEKLKKTLLKKERWVVVHRSPVIHFGSLWPLRVVPSQDPAPVARLPLGLLPPMGADFDGDTVSMVPVLSDSKEVMDFCRLNAPLVHGDLFQHPTEKDTPQLLFPLSKDLQAAHWIWKNSPSPSPAAAPAAAPAPRQPRQRMKVKKVKAKKTKTLGSPSHLPSPTLASSSWTLGAKF